MVFFLTWFSTFLQNARDVSQLNSGLLATFAGVGRVEGSLTGGFYFDWLLKRRGKQS
jgi:ACS family glucarate transporter-like MFS transporter